MKKVLMIAALAVAFSSSAMAQEDNKEVRRMDPNEMAKHRTEMMAERYGLNDAQKEKLNELNVKFAEAMPMRPGGDQNHRMGPPQGGDQSRRMGPPPAANRQDAQQGQENNNRREARPDQRGGRGPGFGGPRFDPEKMKEYEEGLKEILTPEQYEKYQSDRQNRQQFRQRPQN